MHKFPITEYYKFSELPLDKFNNFKFSVYILDFDWNYLFINDFAINLLGDRGKNLIGKNIWKEFKELDLDPSFKELRRNTEKGITTNMTATSPILSKRLNISSYALQDCYYFSESILPDKDNLIDELRHELGKKK